MWQKSYGKTVFMKPCERTPKNYAKENLETLFNVSKRKRY